MNEFARRRVWGPNPSYPLVEQYEPKNTDFVVIAGPCSVESEEQINELAEIVKVQGATHLRGGVFRAGTYPGKRFGYIDESLIAAYHSAAQRFNLKNIIEILDYTEYEIDRISEYCECFQIGARQMQNYTLLKVVARFAKEQEKAVFLKRNPGSTLDEWLGAAEHLLKAGAPEVYLIERGGSSHLNHVRWDLSLSLIPAVKALSNIPVIVDASHGTGRRDLVKPMTLAGVAAGAAGILVEVHQDPVNSLSDSDQAITPKDFAELMNSVFKLRKAMQ